jgi:hypothetical protein
MLNVLDLINLKYNTTIVKWPDKPHNNVAGKIIL